MEDKSVLLVKPQTYMNRSGEAVAAVMRYYKLEPARLIVIYDDVSMELGKLRVRMKGSAGGHNGVKSIIEALGDEWARIKVGVGSKPSPDYDLADWVLSRFSTDELKTIQNDYERICAAVSCLLAGEPARAMERCNG